MNEQGQYKLEHLAHLKKSGQLRHSAQLKKSEQLRHSAQLKKSEQLRHSAHLKKSGQHRHSAQLKQLEQEIQAIKSRNRKVEADKAWELSLTRKILVAVLTYFVIVIFFYFAELPEPFLNAIVPTIGFMLSTLSVPFFKKVWVKYIYKK
ncbi:MAG: hypothetical protein WC285_06190 [Candidatus Gracilibacteria bacterium]|jgi:hypothetical protein